MGDEFLESIFTLEESQKLELRKPGLSAPTLEVPVQIEGVEFRTMAAMRIYARYFPVIFLAFFMSASISVDFSRLYKVSQLEEMTFKSSPVSFAWSQNCLYCGRCVYGTKHGCLSFSLPAKIDITVHTDVELNRGPTSSSSGPIVDAGVEVRSGCVINKGFKVQPAIVTNLHFRTEWQQSCSYSADINSAML